MEQRTQVADDDFIFADMFAARIITHASKLNVKTKLEVLSYRDKLKEFKSIANDYNQGKTIDLEEVFPLIEDFQNLQSFVIKQEEPIEHSKKVLLESLNSIIIPFE